MVRKTLREAKSNLDDSTTYIPSRFESGVERAEWKEKASSDEAEKNFVKKMRQVIEQEKRKKGVEKVSNDEWQEKAVSKGKSIIAKRIRDALDKWEENFGTVYDEIIKAAEKLPPKSLDAMKNIDERLKPIVKAAKKGSEKIG